ncbi:secG, partial [Symbiodinium sp. KB8]
VFMAWDINAIKEIRDWVRKQESERTEPPSDSDGHGSGHTMDSGSEGDDDHGGRGGESSRRNKR